MWLFKLTQSDEYLRNFSDLPGNPEEYLPSVRDFEDMMQRMYNINKEYYKEDNLLTWKQVLNHYGSYNVSLVLESESIIYNKYLSVLPENVHAIDIIELYLHNKLPINKTKQPYKYDRIDIPTQSTSYSPELPWQPNQSPMNNVENIYNIAKQRVTNKNKTEVLNARKELFLIYCSNDRNILSEKLNIKTKELSDFIRKFSGLNVSQKQTEDSLNNSIPLQYQWKGITNSNFIGKQKINHEDLDKLVDSIEITNEGRFHYGSDKGESIRRHLVTSFMAINTNIEYKDLKIKIGKCEKSSSRGQYFNNEKKIIISDINQNTVSHELGHYLDYKFMDEINKKPKSTINNGLSEASLNYDYYKTVLSKEHIIWIIKYKTFVDNLTDKSDISSEYTQRRSEVFARFIDKFISWTSGANKYNRFNDYTGYVDNFSMNEYKVFVRLLQEHSYLTSQNLI